MADEERAGESTWRECNEREVEQEVQARPASLVTSVLCDQYGEIRRIAAAALRHERIDHTLQATAVAHEVWLRISGSDGVCAGDPIAFRGLVATVVRHVLVDHARARNGPKRGEGWRRVPFTDVTSMDERTLAGRAVDVDLVDLDGAIERLRAIAPRQAQIVEMRFFGGFTHEECARRLGVSLGTVELDWRLARHWLRSTLTDWDS